METRIAIVEDDAADAAAQIDLLQQKGYTVKLAESCAGGIKLVADWKPDLVIMDLVLPDGNGVDLLKSIVSGQKTGVPDVIVVSKRPDTEAAFEALELGAADFVRKPFAHREFLLRVSALVQRRKYRKESEAARAELETDLKKLSRYFSRDLIESILDGRIANTLSGEIMPATIMMFDIRNSTSLGESMVPALFFQFLTAFFGEISQVIYDCGGSINKFTGDGFLATFGLRSYSEKCAIDALDCAMKLRERIAKYNRTRPPYLKNPVGYGIGITTGDVYAGNVGSAQKLEYTVFGDPVNFAARLENMTKKANVDILIDEKTRSIGGERLKVRRLQTTSVRGKAEAVTMFYPESF